jgi:hypothetical protein
MFYYPQVPTTPVQQQQQPQQNQQISNYYGNNENSFAGYMKPNFQSPTNTYPTMCTSSPYNNRSQFYNEASFSSGYSSANTSFYNNQYYNSPLSAQNPNYNYDIKNVS